MLARFWLYTLYMTQTTQPTVTTHSVCITVPRAALLQQLIEAKRIVDTKAASPILHTVCLTIQGSEVVVAATDLRRTVLGRVAGQGDAAQPLSGCLNVKKAHDIVKALGTDVTLEIVETTTERQEGGTEKRWCESCGGQVALRTGYAPEFCTKKTCSGGNAAHGGRLVDFRIVTTVTTTSMLSSGKSRFNLTTLRGSDFPKMPDAAALAKLTWQTLPTAILAELIDGTLFSASQDTTREQLSACLLESLPGDAATGTAPKLRMVSTDGHRLSRIDREGVLALPSASILIPRDGVVELRKLCGAGNKLRNVEVAVAKNVLYFRAAGQMQTTYSTILSSASFPPYMQVIPRDAIRSIVVDVASLKEAIEKIKLVAEKPNYVTTLRCDDTQLDLLSCNTDGDTVEDTLSCAGEGVRYSAAAWRQRRSEMERHYRHFAQSDYAKLEVGVSHPFYFGINAQYLLDALEHVATPTVKLSFADESAPTLLHGVGDGSSRDGGDIFVVMPCRL